MTDSTSDINQRVTDTLSEALDLSSDEIQPDSSLIDDLGAQSIDFLDIRFRIESEFSIEVDETEMWQGAFDTTDRRWMIDGKMTDQGLERLKSLQPDYPWERLRAPVTKADLPRLITVSTITRYIGAHIPAS